MNSDLARQLEEMGAEYSAVVGRLKRAREVEPRMMHVVMSRPSPALKAGYLVAASLAALVVCLVTMTAGRSAPRGAAEYRLADQGTQEAIREIIRTQNADGCWKSDFLTKRNAEALRLAQGGEARIAYKKACRAMRLKGIL